MAIKALDGGRYKVDVRPRTEVDVGFSGFLRKGRCSGL